LRAQEEPPPATRPQLLASSGYPLTTTSFYSWAHQEPLLFGLSVEENVGYSLSAARAREGGGRVDFNDAAVRARVEEACRRANAHEFVGGLSDGYATLVGERGIKLSGGQKQRVAIARALLAEPRVLLLDEATSALDSESERLVQDAIDGASSGRTVMVVAHRLSTVRDADQIAVLSKGVVEDCGSHDDLMERCGTYQTLVRRQVDGAAATPPPPARHASSQS